MLVRSAILSALALAASVSADIHNPKAAAKLLRSARRLQEENNGNQQNQQQEGQEGQENQWDMDDGSFLNQYSLKLISCNAGETIYTENGYEANSVVLRLCPKEDCDSQSRKGCSSGYGDFVVGLQTYIDAFFEDQGDNIEEGRDEFGECRQYEAENGYEEWQQRYQANANNGYQNYNRYQNYENYEVQQYAEQTYYIGPTCTADGSDVRVALFSDENCAYESNTAFEKISNGWSLPYYSGGLVSTNCFDCAQMNDNYEYEQASICAGTYELGSYFCEEKMAYTGYNSAKTQGCDKIYDMIPHSMKEMPKLTSNVVKAIIWSLVAVSAIVGLMWLGCCRSQRVLGRSGDDGVLIDEKAAVAEGTSKGDEPVIVPDKRPNPVLRLFGISGWS